MSRQEIKDGRGKLLGAIEDKGKEVLALDATGRRKGRFDKQQNLTFDAAGNEVGKGNLLIKLLQPPVDPSQPKSSYTAMSRPSSTPPPKPGMTKYGTPIKPK
ncbi:MAG: hypothetical protein U1E65_27465 [Myxococcota bacterium]